MFDGAIIGKRVEPIVPAQNGVINERGETVSQTQTVRFGLCETKGVKRVVRDSLQIVFRFSR
jgi:hypothetical protein